MDARLSIGTVHIVEWLRSDDRRTGLELYKALEPLAASGSPPVETTFVRVASRTELIDALRSVKSHFRATRRIPLIHLETHGNEDGIGTSGTDAVLWPDPMRELTTLNEATGLRLTLFLAACEGIWGIKMLQPATRAAFLALVGPKQPLEEDELAEAARALYGAMFGGGTGNDAFRAMNDAINPAEPTFAMINAAMAFEWVYREFLTRLCTPAALHRRSDAVVAKVDAAMRAQAELGGLWA